MKESIELYFNEQAHKYTDIYGNPYTSVTTLIDKYKNKFKTFNVAEACESIGKNPFHKDYLKYKGKNKFQIMKEWETIKNDACEAGTEQHNELETAIKYANNYRKVSGTYINGRICTVPEIINDPSYGALNLDYFREKAIDTKFPVIFETISHLVNKGFNIYAEVGVFHFTYLISGLIDVFAYNPDKRIFLVLDWKTNRAPITYEAGYFRKDINGNLTSEFVSRTEFFNYPINHLPQSTGNSYGLQLNMYSHLASLFNIEHRGNILFHITHDYDNDGLKIVHSHKLPDLTSEVKNIMEHHFINNPFKNIQSKLFNNLKLIN